MPGIVYPYNLISGLSDFWIRFFADAPTLKSLYDGSAISLGQAYLDYLSGVLNLSLEDAPVFNKEYYKLLTVREDQVAFQRGVSSSDDRWAFPLPDNVVSFARLDNKVLEPDVALEELRDYDLEQDQATGQATVLFKVDPTDPTQSGTPTLGFARRALDVETGGSFDDPARSSDWITLGVRKGDTLRFLILNASLSNQRKTSDQTIVLVKPTALYVSTSTPISTAAQPQAYVVLRRPPNSQVSFEPMTFSGGVATLAHTRLDQGSVRVFAKRLSDGADVVENVDYSVDYEKGLVYQLTSWVPASSNTVNYTWQQEVYPATGGSPPRFSTTGAVQANPTARVWQIALWAPDALVDRMGLANNFGSMIGFIEPSSENYRAFLRGIFQLYILGPVLERIESAINVLLGLPVIKSDGETLISVDSSNPLLIRVTTQPAATPFKQATYDFPPSTPMRTDLVPGMTLDAFEPLTTAAVVSDYISDPEWWYYLLIPTQMFDATGTHQIPTPLRRFVNPDFVSHVIGAEDDPRIGDPGLVIGADDEGNVPDSGVILRHRMAFVLMDRYLKFHTFIVKFDSRIFADPNVARYIRSFDDVQKLIQGAKPAHTFAFLQPLTVLLDQITVAESGYFQPPDQPGQDPDGPELFPSQGDVDPSFPWVELGLFVFPRVGGPAEHVFFVDDSPTIGSEDWEIGDYFHYEVNTDVITFVGIGDTHTLSHAPASPRRRRLVRVYVAATVGGKKVVEDVDYSVDYALGQVTPLTTWDSFATISVSFIQLNIGNTADAPADQTVGDMPLLINGVDPAAVRKDYPPVVDWSGNTVTDQDLSLVERALTIQITSPPPPGDPANLYMTDQNNTRTFHRIPGTGWVIEQAPGNVEPDGYFPNAPDGLYARSTSKVFALGAFSTLTDPIGYITRDSAGDWAQQLFGSSVINNLPQPSNMAHPITHTITDIDGDGDFIVACGWSICPLETFQTNWVVISTDNGATWTIDKTVDGVVYPLEGLPSNGWQSGQGWDEAVAVFVDTSSNYWVQFKNTVGGNIVVARWNGSAWSAFYASVYGTDNYTWGSSNVAPLAFGSTIVVGGNNFSGGPPTHPSVRVSTNGGTTWATEVLDASINKPGNITLLKGTSPTDVWAHWQAQDNSEFHVYQRTGTNTWVNNTPPWNLLIDGPAFALAVDPFGAYVNGGVNIWVFNKGTSTWSIDFTDPLQDMVDVVMDVVE